MSSNNTLIKAALCQIKQQGIDLSDGFDIAVQSDNGGVKLILAYTTEEVIEDAYTTIVDLENRVEELEYVARLIKLAREGE
jgi:hypothetical protein